MQITQIKKNFLIGLDSNFNLAYRPLHINNYDFLQLPSHDFLEHFTQYNGQLHAELLSIGNIYHIRYISDYDNNYSHLHNNPIDFLGRINGVFNSFCKGDKIKKINTHKNMEIYNHCKDFFNSLVYDYKVKKIKEIYSSGINQYTEELKTDFINKFDEFWNIAEKYILCGYWLAQKKFKNVSSDKLSHYFYLINSYAKIFLENENINLNDKIEIFLDFQTGKIKFTKLN